MGLEYGLEAMTSNGTTLGTGDKYSKLKLLFLRISADHDKVGEQFLSDLGFPSEVTQFVRGHVQVGFKHEMYKQITQIIPG